MKAFVLPSDIRNAILADLGECQAKHVLRAINTLSTLQTIAVPSPEEREAAVGVSTEMDAKNLHAEKLKAFEAMSAARQAEIDDGQR